MKNRNPGKGLNNYILLIFILLSLSPFINPLKVQSQTNATGYTALIQQADKALGDKDYPAALLFYGKARNLNPELTYASEKIKEINTSLDVDADSRSRLFEDIILKAENLYKQRDYPLAKTEYQKALVLDPSAQFPKDRLVQISAIFTDPDDLAYFNDAVTNGDRALAASEYDKAIEFYEAALSVKPDAKVVKDKISNTKKQQVDNKVRTAQSAKIITAADKFLQDGKRAEARDEYEKALALTPENTYAKQKIQEIDAYLDKKKAQQATYDKSIDQADQFYINRDFASARLKYQEALQAKPEARYPKEMLEKTKSGESQLLSDQQKYDAALASAESLFKSADYEASLIGFKSAAAIKPTENYPNTKIAEIEKLLSERTSRKDAYDIAIKNGDQAFDEKKYDPALAHYRNALTLLPGEKYPVQKIDEITALVDQQKTLDENYKNSIAEADKQFNLNKFEEAIVLYTKASGYKPDETYPQQKITEAQGKLSDSKSKKEIYANAIANGNRLLSEFKYNEALDAYELSRSVNPFAEYPISKISEINFLLNKYDKDIEKGNKSLSSGNFNLALESYQAASTIKPSEQYPKDKIAETNAAITAHQKVTEKYNTAVNTGDQLFAGKEYESALVAYQEAADLKTNEKYPSEQIAKINKLLSDLHSSDENYSKAIASADRSFTDQKYTEAIAFYTTALKIKPAETYPKSQIDKINVLVAEQKMLDSEYLMAVELADKLLAAKKYDEAILGYRKALALKSAEKYPSDKITETEKQLADLKTTQETYDKAITDGDKYYSAKDYPNSLASFKNAGSIKPGDAYPKQKITEIEAILDNDKAEVQRYQEAIIQADKLFSDQKYSEALVPYQRASKIKPTEKYPKDQVVKINQLIAEQKKVDDDYQRLIKDGAAQLNDGKYTEARRLYSDAGILKPKEKLPKDIIAEIDGILADLKDKDQSYNKHISAGDVFYTGKKLAEAISSYNSASALKPAETYPKAQIEKINNLLAENKKLDESYNTLIVSADILYDRKKYSDAVLTYRNALSLKPTEKYPAEKIADAEKQIADLKALEDTYTKAIADGDKKLAEKDYANALSAFKIANSVKQEELYPRQKITEIQAILDKNKAENDRYLDAVALADKFFTTEKYREALEPYQRASTIKPGEKYPHEQITRISQLLAEQKKLDDDYQNLITQAEDQLDAKKYDIARGLFTNAGNLKPKENLPKIKIAEIDGILANIKLKDENYTKAINIAAGLYSVKNLAGSIMSYEEAQVIKPSEKFPAERIAAIRTELAAIDDRYVKAISIGDSKLASKNMMEALNAYQDALEIKPGEDYPESKIAEINSSLSAQKAEQDQLYDSYINEGIKSFETKDYSGAKSAFTKASGIKPAEAFPKQRIADINKIIEEIGLARKAEYNKAIGEADKLYNTKIFDQAIDAYEAASKINPDDSYPQLQISKIRKYMADHSIQDLFAQTLLISEGTEKKFTFSAIEPRLRKNNYIVLKARSAGKSAPKVYLNYGKDNQKNGGIVLRSLDKTVISDYLIRISVQDKWYREDNNWISLFVETGDIEITKVQIAAGE